MVVRVELGIQQGVNSTLNSYLEKLLIMLTGSFGRKGTNQLHSWLQPLWGNSPGQKFSATGDEVIAGLLSSNIFPDALLGGHPDRLRGVWIDSSNPANTASNTKAVERALRSLDLWVVVDVAMTETVRLAYYVLPASSQYEKTEFTLFNFEFPTNYFHVRAGVLPPLEGTLPEPEIYTRLARALGLLPGDNVLAPLREAARRSRVEFAAAFRASLDPAAAGAPKEFPFMLAAGQRRMFNANQISRDPAWRRDDPDGALLINSADLDALGASDGDWIAIESTVGRLIVRCKIDDSMRNGQLALPHGYGQSYPAPDGECLTNGPRINLLTESGNRDPIAGTPYHKHVAARLSLVSAHEAAAYQMQSERIHASAAG